MSADVALWGTMSRVESPFHAIAAQALDDPPPAEADVDPRASTSPEAGPMGDAVKAWGSPLENGTNELEENKEEVEEEIAGEESNAVGGSRPRKASVGGDGPGDTVTKKSKKRTNVWTKTTSRKGAKKNGSKSGGVRSSDNKDDNVVLKPFHQEDDSSYPILLSKVHKAEKIELSADRLAASGSKGYRMVRATRGVGQGAWYFEIYIERLGETGHTRLGWCTRKGDIQAPVGYDAHSYAYRDVDGSRVHSAIREPCGEPYHEKDYIGFYINLPREPGFERKPEEDVYGFKGQLYVVISEEPPLKPVPGSEILFFKNGVCMGVAYKDINDGTYYPAASMYTQPSQDYSKVVFNFGPDFKYPPTDLGDRPYPSPMSTLPCPRQIRPDEALKISTGIVTEPTEIPGEKEQIAPDHVSVGETKEAVPPKKEKVPKRVGKVPLPKKLVKVPGVKAQVGKALGMKVPGLKGPGVKLPVGKNGPPLKRSKFGGIPLNSNKKINLARKIKKDPTSTAVGSLGTPARRWSLEDGIKGGMDVAVVVVESSTGV